jgi:hypothetical protein
MKKVIGNVGVDSGQILVCDPGYIDSEWKHEEFDGKTKYRHTDGTILTHTFNNPDGYTSPETIFTHYDHIFPKYGKCMNDMIRDKEVIELDETDPPIHPFSYNACCKKTLSSDDDGQLCFNRGHDGAGVVTNTGYGDGYYPVVADIDDRTGRVKSITVVFMEDEDDSISEESREEEDDYLNNDPPNEDHGERDDRIRESFQ